MRFLKYKYAELVTLDWKNFFRTAIILVGFTGFLIFMLNLPTWRNKSKINNFEGKCIGKIISVDNIEYNSQYFDGGQIKTSGFKIHYEYIVRKIIYHKSINLSGRPGTYRLIKKYNKGLVSISVKYDLENPNKSTIILDE